MEGGRDYHPYGAQRSAWATLHTDRTFTGQKEDGTGLLYYNARYYDPALGTFISPDTVVPDAGMTVDYNRFLYARGNPLKYSDPSGYAPQYYGDPDPNNAPCATDWCWENRWYEAHGYGYISRTHHWDMSIPYRFADLQIWRDYVGELTEDLQEEPSRLSWQDWSYVARINVAKTIYDRLPKGESSLGFMGDVGIGADFLGDFGVFFDKSGNFAVGGSLGFGGMTEINADLAIYLQSFPWAGSIDVFHGDTLNVGLSDKILQGIGGSESHKRNREFVTFDWRNSLLHFLRAQG